MTRDPARRPPSPVVVASNAALLTGVVLVVVSLFTVAFVLVVGVFLLAVSLGLALVNRSQRATRTQRRGRR